MHRSIKFSLSAAIFIATAADASALNFDFARAMEAAMNRMMERMHITSTGDVDRDFASMMIPHHEGAIDMAVLELRCGRNVQLKRIAQEIIIDQEQEIVAMHLAIGEPLPSSAPAPTQTTSCQKQ
jgi:uncharacterized protein (DUF305 family)